MVASGDEALIVGRGSPAPPAARRAVRHFLPGFRGGASEHGDLSGAEEADEMWLLFPSISSLSAERL
jgi:hypothetical protein